MSKAGCSGWIGAAFFHIFPKTNLLKALFVIYEREQYGGVNRIEERP